MIKYYIGMNYSISELATTGYVQEGYDTILTMDKWKATVCTEHSVTHEETIDSLDIDVERSSISVSELRSFVNAMEAAGVDEVNVDDNTESEYDSSMTRGYIRLEKCRDVSTPMDDAGYKLMYSSYVYVKHCDNQKIWEKERIARRNAENQDKNDRAIYLKLHDKYAKEYGHVDEHELYLRLHEKYGAA